MMFNVIPCNVAVGLQITHSFQHSFIAFFLQCGIWHKVTAILCSNIYTLRLWSIVFDSGSIVDKIFSFFVVHFHVYIWWKIWSGEEISKKKWWVHHIFLSKHLENMVTWSNLFRMFVKICDASTRFFPKTMIILASNCPQITVKKCRFLQVDAKNAL